MFVIVVDFDIYYGIVSKLKHFLATLLHQDSTHGLKLNIFTIKFSSPGWKPKVETLKEDIKVVVMGKPGCETWEDFILNKKPDFFGLSEFNFKERKG